MGNLTGEPPGALFARNGAIERCDFAGRNRETVVPRGGTCTPKQIAFDAAGNWLYWADREGMAVMRVRPDGSELTTLIRSGDGVDDRGDPANHCVGIALDTARKQVYWTQKGPPNGAKGRLFRAGIEIPVGETAASRTDIIEVLGGLPEPIDLQFDSRSRGMFWTDRGALPGGNSGSRDPVDRADPP